MGSTEELLHEEQLLMMKLPAAKNKKGREERKCEFKPDEQLNSIGTSSELLNTAETIMIFF